MAGLQLKLPDGTFALLGGAPNKDGSFSLQVKAGDLSVSRETAAFTIANVAALATAYGAAQDSKQVDGTLGGDVIRVLSYSAEKYDIFIEQSLDGVAWYRASSWSNAVAVVAAPILATGTMEVPMIAQYWRVGVKNTNLAGSITVTGVTAIK